MAKLPTSKKVLREDVKEAPSWIEVILSTMNSFFEDVYFALNKQITFRENISCQIKELEIETSSTYGPEIPSQSEVDTLKTQIVPTGSVLMWSTATAPTNYLLCNGSAVSRTTFSALFAVVGTTFGAGDGSTTFNLPNFQGLVPRGTGSQAISGRTKTGPALGSTQEDQMQRITGSLTGRIFTVNAGAASSASGAFSIGADQQDTANRVAVATRGFADPSFNSANSPNARASSTTDGETRASSLGINFIIKT